MPGRIVELGQRAVGVDEGAGLEVAVGLEVIDAADPAQRALVGRGQAQFLAGHAQAQVLALAGLEAEADEAARGVHRVGKIEVAAVILGQPGVGGDRAQGRERQLVIDLDAEVARRALGLAQDARARGHDDVGPVLDGDAVPGGAGLEVAGAGAQVDIQARGRLVQQARTEGAVVIDFVDPLAGIGIADQATELFALGRDAVEQLVLDQRPTQSGGDVEQFAVASFDGGESLALVGRRPGLDIDGAADRVATIQRALRALEHLDPLDVEQVHPELLLVILRHAVDHHRHRRIGIVDLGDPAQHDEGIPIGEGIIEGHIRGQVDERLGAVDAHRFDLLVAERLHRHRDILQALEPALGADDDGLDPVDAVARCRLFLHLLGPGAAGSDKYGGDGECERSNTVGGHACLRWSSNAIDYMARR